MNITQFENDYIFDMVNSLLDVHYNDNRIREILLQEMFPQHISALTEEQIIFLIDRCSKEE